jgi:AAA ATPase domain
MKVTLKNLGLLKQAEFTLGDLTIICGGNNMGKTYATYALFGFLYFWKGFSKTGISGIDFNIDESKIDEVISAGTSQSVDLRQFSLDGFQLIIEQACKEYNNELAKVFASANRFNNSEFKINLDAEEIEHVHRIVGEVFFVSFRPDHKILVVEVYEKVNDETSRSHSLLARREYNTDIQGVRDLTKKVIIDGLIRCIIPNLFPNPFIISSERTGAATFRKELDFARNRMLKTIAHGIRDIDTITSVLERGYQDYPLPVEANLEFTRNLERIVKQRSFVADRYPEILNEFADMIGGDYQVTGEDILSYVPHKNNKLKLSLTESSSAIRSLLDLGFYLRHQAAVGDLLMIDEPELNLHPDNQRRIARLLARLVNLGIKVFITTHSSYIIKELNTLIMLNRDEPHLKQIAAEENYLESELLSPDKVKVYVAKEALVQLDGQKKKTRSPTLVPAKISPELGIELTSFDTAINTINRIQERIVWGSD